jgi:uroporphyrinogen-III synthase
MHQNKTNILCTRPVDESLVLLAASAGISIDIIPFIHTEKIQSADVQQKIGQAFTQTAAIVFTSMNAVEAAAPDATVLAQRIIKNKIEDKIIFFCGDRRRMELPVLLHENGIEIEEIEVYTTIETPQKIEKEYDGILFFSPSAVTSFFRNNSVSDKTTLFAIGNTTADEIKKYSRNKIVISDEATKKILIEEAIKFFQTNEVRY